MLIWLFLLCMFHIVNSKDKAVNNTKLSSKDLLNFEEVAGNAVSKTLIRAGGFRVFKRSLNELHIQAIEGNMILLQCPDVESSDRVVWYINGSPFTRKESTWRRYMVENDLALFPADSLEDGGMFECYVGENIHGQGILFIETQLHAIGAGLMEYGIVGFGVILTQIIGLSFYILYLNFFAKHPGNPNEKAAAEKDDEEEFISEAEDDEQTEIPQKK